LNYGIRCGHLKFTNFRAKEKVKPKYIAVKHLKKENKNERNEKPPEIKAKEGNSFQFGHSNPKRNERS
jgi:hypothetical protein